jgi:hypothetical protein
MPDHSLNVLTASSCEFRSAIFDVISVASFACYLLDSVRLLELIV